jgi:hypothetical protein
MNCACVGDEANVAISWAHSSPVYETPPHAKPRDDVVIELVITIADLGCMTNALLITKRSRRACLRGSLTITIADFTSFAQTAQIPIHTSPAPQHLTQDPQRNTHTPPTHKTHSPDTQQPSQTLPQPTNQSATHPTKETKHSRLPSTLATANNA